MDFRVKVDEVESHEQGRQSQSEERNQIGEDGEYDEEQELPSDDDDGEEEYEYGDNYEEETEQMIPTAKLQKIQEAKEYIQKLETPKIKEQPMIEEKQSPGKSAKKEIIGNIPKQEKCSIQAQKTHSDESECNETKQPEEFKKSSETSKIDKDEDNKVSVNDDQDTTTQVNEEKIKNDSVLEISEDIPEFEDEPIQ